jgi:hypothetical protein
VNMVTLTTWTQSAMAGSRLSTSQCGPAQHDSRVNYPGREAARLYRLRRLRESCPGTGENSFTSVDFRKLQLGSDSLRPTSLDFCKPQHCSLWRPQQQIVAESYVFAASRCISRCAEAATSRVGYEIVASRCIFFFGGHSNK